MTHQNSRIIITAFLLAFIVTCKSTAQSGIGKEFSYNDVYGNTISVNNTEKLPKPFDTTFIRWHLNGLSFNPRLTETSDRFFYSIVSIKTIDPEIEFEFRVFTSPKIKSADIIIKQRGYSHWRVKLKRINNELKIDTVEHISTEI